MRDPLRRLLARLDGGPVTLTADDRRDLDEDWPALEAVGLVAETTPATEVACRSCDEPHGGEVFRSDLDGFPTRWFHRCDTYGSVRLEPDEVRRWAVRVPPLGRVLTGRDAEERVPGLVWRLGPVGPGERVGWLVAGWRRQVGVADAVPELRLPKAVVFVPGRLPPPAVWGTAPPVVVPVADVVRSDGTTLTVNAAALAAFLPPEPVVVEADTRPRLTLPPGTVWEDLTLVVEDHHVTLVLGPDRFRIGYEGLGLMDGRKGTPVGAWKALVVLAESGGELGTRDRVRTKSGVLRNNVAGLRAALQHWAGLFTDPFHPTRPKQPYRARFHVRRVPFEPVSDLS